MFYKMQIQNFYGHFGGYGFRQRFYSIMVLFFIYVGWKKYKVRKAQYCTGPKRFYNIFYKMSYPPHPLSYLRSGPGGSRISMVVQMSSPRQRIPAPVPGQMSILYVIPPVRSCPTQGSSPSRSCQENIRREVPGRHPNQKIEPTLTGSYRRSGL